MTPEERVPLVFREARSWHDVVIAWSLVNDPGRLVGEDGQVDHKAVEKAVREVELAHPYLIKDREVPPAHRRSAPRT